MPTSKFKVSSAFYSFVIPLLSFIIGFLFLLIMLGIESKKRRLHRSLHGKRLFMETARKKKSKQYLLVCTLHLFIYTIASIMCNRLWRDESLAYDLVAAICATSTGLVNVIVYLKVLKKPQDEVENYQLLTKHSLRKSTVESIIHISGGFQPDMHDRSVSLASNNVSKDTTDFGIFIGGDDDDDDEEDADFYDCKLKTPKSLYLHPVQEETLESQKHCSTRNNSDNVTQVGAESFK